MTPTDSSGWSCDLQPKAEIKTGRTAEEKKAAPWFNGDNLGKEGDRHDRAV
jgi:hypothetical protein